MKTTPFHKDFKLQGNSFNSVNEILEFSKELSKDSYFFLHKWFNDKGFVEVKTSGSTGTPKRIQLKKNLMINSAIAMGEYFKLPKKTTALLCMSPNYIAGKMMLVRAITLGWHLDIVEAVSNPLKNNQKKYDFSAMVPLQLHNSLNEIHKIKKLIVGGGVVSNDLLSKIQHVETEIVATYGMTETITHIAVKKLNHFNPVIASEAKQSLYHILPNINISKDRRGCLIIDAPKVSEGRIITNDLVELISETEFNWLGRYDNVINSGGVKIFPEQIEKKLSTVIKNRFFVAGIPDVVLGEKLILVVEGIKNYNISNQVKKLKTLSKFEIPKKIYFVNKFVKTETKKINRIETLKQLQQIL